MLLTNYIPRNMLGLVAMPNKHYVYSISDACRVHSEFRDIIPECNVGYSVFNEDDNNYDVGWKSVNQSTTLLNRTEYLYTSSDNIDSYPFLGRHALYMGGGYVTRMKDNYADTMEQIKLLENETWIDKYTRAVFVEISCYNAHVI